MGDDNVRFRTEAGPYADERSGPGYSKLGENIKFDRRKAQRAKYVKALNWISLKTQALAWVAAAVIMIYWTNFFRVIWEHPLVNRTALYGGFTGLSFNMAMIVYMFLHSEVKKIDIDTIMPSAIPVMTVIGLITAVFFFVALYPVWGILVIPIQVVFFLGYLNAGQFLPAGWVGSILMFIIFFAAFFTSILIPHEGLAHYVQKV